MSKPAQSSFPPRKGPSSLSTHLLWLLIVSFPGSNLSWLMAAPPFRLLRSKTSESSLIPVDAMFTCSILRKSCQLYFQNVSRIQTSLFTSISTVLDQAVVISCPDCCHTLLTGFYFSSCFSCGLFSTRPADASCGTQVRSHQPSAPSPPRALSISEKPKLSQWPCTVCLPTSLTLSSPALS